MRDYEITVIVQPQLDDEARSQLIARVSNWIAPDAAEEEKPVENHWGQRQLAYPIRNFREGYYVFFEAKVDPAHIAELERNLQYVDDVLRYLVIRKEE